MRHFLKAFEKITEGGDGVAPIRLCEGILHRRIKDRVNGAFASSSIKETSIPRIFTHMAIPTAHEIDARSSVDPIERGEVGDYSPTPPRV